MDTLIISIMVNFVCLGVLAAIVANLVEGGN